MAYSIQNPPIRHTNRVGGGTYWWYESDDSIATMAAAGYITNARYLKMEAGDILIRVDSNGVPAMLAVKAVLPDGSATLKPQDGTTIPLPQGGTVQDAVNWVTPEMFGAVGDGVTNDAPALQAAANALNAAGGGLLLLGPKTYLYASTATIYSNTTIRGENNGVSVLKGNGSATDAFNAVGMNNIVIEHVGFDVNGAISSGFTGGISISDCDNIYIQYCRFFDSNPEMASVSIGTGDGVTTNFSQTFSAFVDRMVLPGTVSVTSGALSATDNWLGGFDGDASAGLVQYGDNNGNWAIDITFSAAPANGANVLVQWGRCDQRQPILILNCSNVFVHHNNLSGGGRIKVGRPGNRCLIHDNVLFGVNDNGITVVDNEDVPPAVGSGATTTEIVVKDNIIYYAATTGIFLGVDGATDSDENLTTTNAIVTGNIIVGNSMNGINFVRPRTARQARVCGNTVLRIGTLAAFTRMGILIQDADLSTATGHTSMIVSGNIVAGAWLTACYDLRSHIGVVFSENIAKGDALSPIGIRLAGDQRRVQIQNNNITGVFRGALAAGSRVYENLLISGNIFEFTTESSNAACLDFGTPTSMTRVRILHNTFIGSGVNSRSCARAQTTTELDIDFVGNDFSQDAQLTAIGLLSGATLASTSRNYGNKGTGARVFTQGSGTPEGVLTAPVGSIFMRTDGGAGTAMYVKESGTGNTGWVAK